MFCDPMQPLNKEKSKTINDYIELIETIARVEYSRLSVSSHLIDYSELVNIGAMAVHVLLTNNKNNSEFNISYVSTAIKWAIKNELRRRYKWYSFKHSKHKEELNDLEKDNVSAKDIEELSKTQVREAIYETILSIDELADAENPTQIKDSSFTPEENLEFKELNSAIKRALKKVPQRERMVLENRFFKNRKIKDLADEMKISSSRVSRIIQSGLDKIRNELKKQDMV